MNDPSPAPPSGALRTAWSHSLPNSPRGLSLARETGWTLVWDDKHWLYLLNHAGAVQAQKHLPGPIVSACAADDGSAWAAAGDRGMIYWLAPDLMPRWERTLRHAAVAIALDSFGQYLAASDVRGNLHLFDRLGRSIGQIESPRPLHHLAFVPGTGCLVASADFGLVACLDLTGRWLWRDGLVAHVGSLSVTGDGERVVLACFTEGLHQYDRKGKKLDRLAIPGPCRLASLSFDGQRILVAHHSKQVHVLDAAALELQTISLERSATALALGALADQAVIALADGPIVGVELDQGERGV